ncbi:MAG: hypothetical protein IJP86_03380 [Synergistaceae bacterium]|nr:hypothetical protein [Synergistaceae bacterium]
MSEAVHSSASKQASKQACLILAYKPDLVFRTLIQMLDHPKNDIFIHMDAKTASYDPADTEALVKHSRVVHVPRIRVQWGAYSQVEADMLMLEAATSQGHYGHYHILSNACLPIKTQDEIAAFFEAHHGVEFVSFPSETFTFSSEERVRYYYPFQEIKGRKGSLPVRAMAKLALILQKILHVHRNKGIKFQKGGDWFSITDELARYALSKREWIRAVFHDTYIPTEEFMHTLIINSHFSNRLFRVEALTLGLPQHMRLIDWKRGEPYTFRLSDLEEIQKSPAMFARKFDEAVDPEIIRRIQELYSR